MGETMLLTFKEKTLQEGRKESIKALNLFLDGKKPEDLANELDLPPDKANELYDNFKKRLNPSNK
jgi:hypothetical protein